MSRLPGKDFCNHHLSTGGLTTELYLRACSLDPNVRLNTLIRHHHRAYLYCVHGWAEDKLTIAEIVMILSRNCHPGGPLSSIHPEPATPNAKPAKKAAPRRKKR